MATELLERAPEAKLLTDGGGTPPENPPLTAAPAENPNGDHRTQADFNAEFSHIAEQYDVDATLGEIAENEGVAGPGFKTETTVQLGSVALQPVEATPDFAAIVNTPAMQELDTSLNAQAAQVEQAASTGVTYENGEDLNAEGDKIIAEQAVTDSQSWKPELSIVETPKDTAPTPPEAPLAA